MCLPGSGLDADKTPSYCPWETHGLSEEPNMFKIHSGNPEERCPSLEFLEIRVTDRNAGGYYEYSWDQSYGEEGEEAELDRESWASMQWQQRPQVPLLGILKPDGGSCRAAPELESGGQALYFSPTGGVPHCPSPGKGVSLSKAASSLRMWKFLWKSPVLFCCHSWHSQWEMRFFLHSFGEPAKGVH